MTDSEVLTVQQILGDGRFAEVGAVRLTEADSRTGYVAVGGSLGRPVWAGNSVESSSEPTAWNSVGVYRADPLECVHLVRLHWPVNALAFHPELPILAIGSGSYDGGYCYEGELTVLDLESGRATSLLKDRREVTELRWRDHRILDAKVSVLDEYEEEQCGFSTMAVAIDLPDWRAAKARSLQVDGPAAEPAEPLAAVADGNHRRQVWAVAALADGRILASLEHVAAECWSATGERQWSVPTSGVGCQLYVDPAENSAAFTNSWGGWTRSGTTVERVELADGYSEALRTFDRPAVVVTDETGRLAIRPQSGPTEVLPSESRVDLGGYDLINHFFDIRRAPALLFLQGLGHKAHQDKWVVAFDPARRQTERLFPLEWDPARNRHLFGGPGVFVDGSLVHATAIHNGAGLLPGNCCVVRRSYPDGKAQWVFTADHQVTAMDTIGCTVYAAFNSGEIVALDATDGRVLGRQHLQVNGHPAVPLSLSARAPGRLVVGTLDGRVLVCETTPRESYATRAATAQ
ncbi:hypothetical protein CU254_03275 [Amycolatopsis sp. AA4]|uniref:PQQ-binding-like beta-propeller repeat protein n=1 Tax=Actinomycetes TaxID=1760 RepID=UPI0001B554E1|nr:MULTISPECIES: PQQ-binding-like beta-propeller repeat protein [Actinomycetes]ATY09595.1 hypothetical protein CU254_03275 [Amycolatopsis sp. AA4]EFL04964.1 predicted protein [Streptomyces sp. AA4]